jgi:hypothetical protein
VRQALDAMHERFDGVPKDDAQFGLYRQCIHMFDQEFMVKVRRWRQDMEKEYRELMSKVVF